MPFETNFRIRVVKLSAEELVLVEFVLEEFLLEEVEVDPVLDFLLNLKYFLPFCDDFLALVVVLLFDDDNIADDDVDNGSNAGHRTN